MNRDITVFISIGSNMPGAKANIHQALEMLEKLPGLRIGACSPFFYTEPQEKTDQAWFYNMAAMLFANEKWMPKKLLMSMHEIEKKLGRHREKEERFGPRPIDLDLITYGAEKSPDPFCTLPHPAATRRAFVLIPLLTIAPGLKIGGQSLHKSLEKLNWKLNGWKIWQKS